MTNKLEATNLHTNTKKGDSIECANYLTISFSALTSQCHKVIITTAMTQVKLKNIKTHSHTKPLVNFGWHFEPSSSSPKPFYFTCPCVRDRREKTVWDYFNYSIVAIHPFSFPSCYWLSCHTVLSCFNFNFWTSVPLLFCGTVFFMFGFLLFFILLVLCSYLWLVYFSLVLLKGSSSYSPFDLHF